jgi:hypothetical protein
MQIECSVRGPHSLHLFMQSSLWRRRTRSQAFRWVSLWPRRNMQGDIQALRPLYNRRQHSRYRLP